jgi:hypothetical protein
MRPDMRPEFLSTDVDVRDYDFGPYPQTGYRDAGERFRCASCRATADAADLVRDDDAHPVQSTRCDSPPLRSWATSWSQHLTYFACQLIRAEGLLDEVSFGAQGSEVWDRALGVSGHE